MANTLSIKNEIEENTIDINIVHPGVCATELFTKSHSKLFNNVIYPLMKFIFHSPKKAALTIIKGVFTETKFNEWIIPGGLFGVWGYPKVKKMKKSIYDLDVIKEASSVSLDMIAKHLEDREV